MCTGHGRCVAVNRCECFSGWASGDCSERSCPEGPAWSGVAVADNVAHVPTPCSARGVCDTVRGVCVCEAGFEGSACERLACGEGGCSGHGECETLRRHATEQDPGYEPLAAPYSNVRAPFVYDTPWDADMTQGCTCDAGFTGVHCEQRVCPTGDDPLSTGQVNEVQLLRCDIDPADPAYQGKQFTLNFLGAVTRPFGVGLAIGDLRVLLEELPTIRVVSVAYSSGSTFCDASYASLPGLSSLTQPASSNIVSVTFLTEHGRFLPRLVVLDQAAAELYGAKNNAVFVAAKGETLAATVPNPATPGGVLVVTQASVEGTKENAPCSGRGRCNEDTGVCACFPGFGSSDGMGAKGSEGDCGYAYLPVTSCPGSRGVECSGHGACSGFPAYACACDATWGGGDCGQRICPVGTAWFAYPYANNAAHPPLECSNKGTCDRVSGRCACDWPFTGAACERLACPGHGPDGCSGHGECLTTRELARYGSTNGVPTPFTYSTDPSNLDTWDGRSTAACRCDAGYGGPACAQRTCPSGWDITLLEWDPALTNEVQSLQCVTKPTTLSPSATFALSFRGATTPQLPYTATAAQVTAALSALPTSGGELVATYVVLGGGLPGSPIDSFCVPPGSAQVARFTFVTAHGDVPPLQVAMQAPVRNDADGSYSALGLGWAASDFTWTGGAAPNFTTTQTFSPPFAPGGPTALVVTPGTSTEVECSGRGLCDRASGVCKCFLGFGASNDARAPGPDENCGWREPIQVGQRGPLGEGVFQYGSGVGPALSPGAVYEPRAASETEGGRLLGDAEAADALAAAADAAAANAAAADAAAASAGVKWRKRARSKPTKLQRLRKLRRK